MPMLPYPTNCVRLEGSRGQTQVELGNVSSLRKLGVSILIYFCLTKYIFNGIFVSITSAVTRLNVSSCTYAFNHITMLCPYREILSRVYLLLTKSNKQGDNNMPDVKSKECLIDVRKCRYWMTMLMFWNQHHVQIQGGQRDRCKDMHDEWAVYHLLLRIRGLRREVTRTSFGVVDVDPRGSRLRPRRLAGCSYGKATRVPKRPSNLQGLPSPE